MEPTVSIPNPAYPSGMDHLEAISSQTVREHAATKLSQLATRAHADSGISDLETFSPEEHVQTGVGVTEQVQATTTYIASSLRSAHDAIVSAAPVAEGGTTEPAAEEVWQKALEIQRQSIFDAKDRHDQAEVDKQLTAHLATIELMIDRESYEDGDKQQTITSNLEPVLEHGMAVDLVGAARQSYGMVVMTGYTVEFDEQRYIHTSVAHVIQDCVPDIEIGLQKKVSLDPAEPPLTDMNEDEWQQSMQKTSLRQAAIAAVIAKQADPESETTAQHIDTLTRHGLMHLDMESTKRDKHGYDNIDGDSITKLLQANEKIRTGEFDNIFTQLRIAREINSNYRNNNGNAQRKDHAVVDLIAANEIDIAAKLITSHEREAGTPEHRGQLYYTAQYNREEPEAEKIIAIIDQISSDKRQLVESRAQSLADKFAWDNSVESDITSRSIRGGVDSLLARSHDPEGAISILESLLTREDGEGRLNPHNASEMIRIWSQEPDSGSEILFNTMERGASSGLDIDQLETITKFGNEVSWPRTLDGRLVTTVEMLDNPTVKELLESPLRNETLAAVSSFGPELPATLEQIFANPLASQLLESSSDDLRLKHDILTHTQQWQDLKVPLGLDPALARDVLAKRVELRHPETGEFLEQPGIAVSILGSFEIPSELTAALLDKQRLFIISVLQAQTLDKLPSPNKEAKLREIMPDDTIRALYIDMYNAKRDSPEANANDLLTKLQAGDEAIDLEWLSQAGELPPELTPSAVLGELRGLSGEYKQWQVDRNRWLKEYAGQTISTNSLVNAWQTRSAALQFDVADNPNAINAWARENAFRIYLEQLRGSNSELPNAQQLEEYNEFISELSRVYTPHKTLPALQRFMGINREALKFQELISAGNTTITIDDANFDVEILSKDDPRGMTIGEDTGCCMTLGGVSEDCIWAGYEDPRYAFFVVSKDGRVRAQSVMYVGSDSNRQEVLVFDNIETNGGTDLGIIRQVYEKASLDLIEQGLFSRRPREVHIGVGYTQQDLLKGLEDAEAVPTPLNVYTDAKAQKLLARID